MKLYNPRMPNWIVDKPASWQEQGWLPVEKPKPKPRAKPKPKAKTKPKPKPKPRSTGNSTGPHLRFTPQTDTEASETE